ncbi:MAG: hypothetical protein ACXU86_25415, partial [Archangium sp.]
SDALASARAWEDEWWRVREPQAPDVLHLLTDFDELLRCDCGAQLAGVLRFRLAKSPTEHGSTETATLEEVKLLDVVRDDVAEAVDFAEGAHMLWNGKPDAYPAALAALAHAPPFDRAARLRKALVEYFAPPDAPARPAPTDPWTTVAGPTRCEACGEVRERREVTGLSHLNFPVSFFGPEWTGGELRPGDRVPCDLAWLAEDVDRGYLARLRHPVPRDSLCILGHRTFRGCHCGAGRGSFVLRFARDPSGVVFESMSLRVVRGPADLADVDFAEAGLLSRERPAGSPFSRRELTHDELIRELLSSEFGCGPSE